MQADLTVSHDRRWIDNTEIANIAEKTIDLFKEYIDNAHAEIERLEQELKCKEDTIEDLQNEISDLEVRCESAEKKLDELGY